MSKGRKNYILFTFTKYYGDVDYSWKRTYYTRERLVRCMMYDKYYHGNEIKNNLVDDMSEAKHETVYVVNKHSYFGGYWRDKKRYFVAKINKGDIVKFDIESLSKEVDAEYEKYKAISDKRQAKYKAERKLFDNYTFRKDPVPGVHNYNNWHRGTLYRHPATTSSKRRNYYTDEDYTFDDVKIRKLPNVYDDLYRHRDKSWKTSCKIKKQWMKHVDKHIDTLNGFDKRAVYV